jgi:hypothetical protein
VTAPEIVRDLPEDQYHADETTLSASGAKVLLGKRPPVISDAMRFGTLFHVAVLEPERLDKAYVALDPEVVGVNKDGSPSGNPTATNAWKAALAKAEEDGRRVISPDDLSTVKAMRDAVYAHPTARALIDQATDTELSCYADHPTGARVRARFDLAGRSVVDLKSTITADPDEFGRKAYNLGYHISAANYLDIAEACGLNPRAFYFINCERVPTPGGAYRVSVTELIPDAIDLGREQMAEACRRWLALGKRIDLPDYPADVQTVDLPAYAYFEDEEELEIA